MEFSHHITNDSFSTGWLINIDTPINLCGESLRSIDTQDCCSFIEMDPEFFSMRWSSDANDFGFSLPRSYPSDIVPADQIISNGHLLPLHVASSLNSRATELNSRATECNSFGSTVYSRSQSVDSSTSMLSGSSRQLEKCYFNTLSNIEDSACSSPGFYSSKSTPSSLKSLCSKSRNFKSPVMIRSCVVESPKKILYKYLSFFMPLYKKVRGLKLKTLKLSRSCRTSVNNSPRTGNAFSSIEWCRSNADISVYDAILHCKRSNGLEK